MTTHTLRGQYSGFFSRAIAYVLDVVIITFSVLITNWLIAQLLEFFTPIRIGACQPIQGFEPIKIACYITTWTLNIFSVTFPVFYFLFFWILAGRTPGQFALGISVVRLDGRRMTFFSGMLRLFGYLLGFLSLGIGFLWILIDDRRQGWQDKIAKTCVVYVWEGRQDEQLVERLTKRLNHRKNTGSSDGMDDENLQVNPTSRDEVEIVGLDVHDVN